MKGTSGEKYVLHSSWNGPWMKATTKMRAKEVTWNQMGMDNAEKAL
jgi:hypothetical protein